MIERIQITEFILSFNHNEGIMWILPIAKTENVFSSICTVNREEKISLLT